MNDGRALTEDAVDIIRKKLFEGLASDQEIDQLIQTIYLQRKILRALFDLFKQEPLCLVSIADPIRNSTLAHYKELVSMEDTPGWNG